MLIKEDFCLKPFNTFGIEVFARRLAIITSQADLAELYEEDQLNDSSLLVLGEGSNVLFTKHYEGLVLLNQIRKFKVEKEDDNFVYLRVNSGENWSCLVDHTVENGWGGLENLSLIPGTVGAAPVQNIGAYGAEFKEAMVNLEAFDLQTGEVKTFTNKDCEFGYRSSIFKTKYKRRFFIISILIRLKKQPILNLEYGPLKTAFQDTTIDSISVKEVSETVKSIRRSKLPEPHLLGNAGSFFKNPVVPFSKIEKLISKFPDMPFYKVDDQHYKIAAGWLIEKCDWKGKRIGDTGVHEMQALVLVNYDKATGQDIFNLSQKIRESVSDKFGVKLEREVTVL